MKQQSKDPFEAAFEEQEESPPDSPVAAVVADDVRTPQNPAVTITLVDAQEDDGPLLVPGDPSLATTSAAPMTVSSRGHVPSATAPAKNKDDDDEEEEENMEVELSKFPSSGDPDKMAKMQ